MISISLGVYNSYLGTVFQGDTINLVASLEVNGQPVTADQVTGVLYTVQTPSIIQFTALAPTTYTIPTTEINFVSLEGIPPAGNVYLEDSLDVEMFSYTGYTGTTLTGVTGGTPGAVLNNNVAGLFLTTTQKQGIVQSNGQGSLLWDNTQAIGPYVATAQFSLVNGEKRSVIVSFTVVDPFNLPEPSAIDQLTGAVWLRLEDIFDSIEGGPWLRDRTMNNFDQNKIAQFVPEALFDINIQMPPTNYDLSVFAPSPGAPPNPNMPLLIKGTLILTIRHLMRSYTEIYTPTGQGQLVWADRTRYQQAWGQVYEVEYQDYISAIRLFKRTEFKFGSSALLTLSKAGRLYPYTNFSTRGIYRGFN